MREDTVKISVKNEKYYNLEFSMDSTQMFKAVRNTPKNSCEVLHITFISFIYFACNQALKHTSSTSGNLLHLTAVKDSWGVQL